MKRIATISEIVESREVLKGTREVIASADAAFDEGRSTLVVRLSTRVLITDNRGRETELSEEWLPTAETVTEHVSFEECQGLAHEIFHRWTLKVRQSIPIPVAA